jgi:hypothetical protein
MSQYYASRSNPNVESNDETYSTIDIYFDSSKGVYPLAPYQNINGGFTCVLANPIILDISHRYVMALVKYSIDTAAYNTAYTTFGIFTDLIEYQYVNNQKAQLLYESYDNLGTYPPAPVTVTNSPPASHEVVNVAWKFINPTTKTIKEISFWILDQNGNPLVTLPNQIAPFVFNSMPTKLEILIKKVNSHVIAVTQL